MRDEQLDVLGGQQLPSNSFMAALKSAVCNDAAKEAKSNTRLHSGTAGGHSKRAQPEAQLRSSVRSPMHA